MMGVRGPVLAATASLSGLSVLAEKKSRRVELAMYALARAIESFTLVLDRLGYLPRRLLRVRIDVVAFSVATAAILHCYSGSFGAHRTTFRGKYLQVFDFILGNEGVDKGSISHVPSSQQLAEMAVRKMASNPALQTMAKVASYPFLASRRASPSPPVSVAEAGAEGGGAEGGGEGRAPSPLGLASTGVGGGVAAEGAGVSRLSVSAEEFVPRRR